VRAELHKRLRLGLRLLTEIFAIGQKRGEIRRDRSAAELARLVQIVMFGTTLAWALNPESPLRGTAEEVWALMLPSIRAAEKRRNAKHRKDARE
jgi:hypothetical protein